LLTTCPPLTETLAAEIERPRELTRQVIRHIVGTYGVDDDAIGPFLTEQLPGLEDYEHDLTLSPLFTPKLADQAVFAELLGRNSVPREDWPGIIAELLARPTQAQLVTTDRRSHKIPLREVVLERYVHRLRLDGTIPGVLFDRIVQGFAAPEVPTLKAVARRAIWEDERRREILARYLETAPARSLYSLDDAVELLRIAEDYRPAGIPDLLARIPPWQDGLRHDIATASNPKAFFNTSIEATHGGTRDQRAQDSIRVAAKENELELLGRLERALAE
jgi:hypothetical protein